MHFKPYTRHNIFIYILYTCILFETKRNRKYIYTFEYMSTFTRILDKTTIILYVGIYIYTGTICARVYLSKTHYIGIYYTRTVVIYFLAHARLVQFYVSDDKIYNTDRRPIKCILINCVIITACGQMKTNMPTYYNRLISKHYPYYCIIVYYIIQVRDWFNLILHFYLYSRTFFPIKTISNEIQSVLHITPQV